MNKTARMLLMNNNKRSRSYDDMGDMNMNRRSGGRRGGYDDRGYEPRNDSDMWVESRRGRDSRGRYTSARSHYDDGEYYHGGDEYGMESYYPMTPYVPPVYQNYGMRSRGDNGRMSDDGYMGMNYDRGYDRGMESRYNDRSERAMNRSMNKPRMNKIGFSIDGEMERLNDRVGTDYRSAAGYDDMDEMSYRQGEKMNGYGRSTVAGPVVMDKQMAHEWLEHMENVDGTTGPHWTMDQTKKVMTQKGIQCDPVLFDLAMNMMYSDYNKVAKKLGMNNTDFYACMAEAFLTDPDSIPPAEKMGNYYEYIVKH